MGTTVVVSVCAAETQTLTPDGIYRSVTQGKPYVLVGQKASFTKNQAKWFIIGAHATPNRDYFETREWPLKGPSYDVLVISDPITDDKVLPKTHLLKNATKSKLINVRACRGEYEPASFVIRTGDLGLRDVEITVSSLKPINRASAARAIESKYIDIRVVKPWYQAGESQRNDKHGVLIPEPEMLIKRKTLTPELLLHDDALVEVNHTYQVNIIRDFKATGDQDRLMPFNCEKHSNKQIWMSLKVPAGSKPGKYEGIIQIRPKNANATRIRLVLTVFPFELKQSKLYYTMYYLNNLKQLKNHDLFHFKTKRSMLKDFIDIKSHGVNNVIVSHRKLNLNVLNDILDLKDSAGLDKTSLYLTAWPKLATDYESLKQLNKDVATLVGFARSRMIQKTYYYAVDELKSELLPLERAMLQTIRDAGAMTMTATDHSFSGIIDDLLDLAIFRGPPERGIVDSVHKRKGKIWIYGNPQGGEEKPAVYRYNYGYLLSKLQVDGIAIYAYQCEMGQDPWDDFDHKKYRDHMMSYPTLTGPIPTIQWEGLREGIDDIRYLSTLIDLAEKSGKERDVASFIAGLDFTQSPNSIRQRIIEKILSLKNN